MNMLPCGPLLKDSVFDKHTGSEAVISVNSVGYPGLKNGAYLHKILGIKSRTIANTCRDAGNFLHTQSLICHISG